MKFTIEFLLIEKPQDLSPEILVSSSCISIVNITNGVIRGELIVVLLIRPQIVTSE